MAAMSRLLPLMAFSTFAIFLLALLATPTNALSNEPHVHARGHDSVAKRKRNAVKRAKRCRPKTTSLAAASTPVATSSAYGHPTTSVAAHPTTAKTSTTPVTTSKPHSTTTTSKAVATTSSTPPSTGGGGTQKLILAWPNGAYQTKGWSGKNLMGVYSWSPSDPTTGGGFGGAPFFPMLWGANQKTAFSKVKYGDYDYCMAFNEPNQSGQSDMSVADGIALWKQYMIPARNQGCKAVSPATTSAPSGLEWILQFLKDCPECDWDVTALHWYDVSLPAFKSYVTNFHTSTGKDVWITEFACQNFNGGAQCTCDETVALHKGMAKFAAQNSWLKGIAPFGAMHEMQGVNPCNQLMNSDGTPNALAQIWLNGDWNSY